MSSGETEFIKSLRDNGYEGHLDPTVFQSVPKPLMKWLSENITSSVLLKPDELNRFEDFEKENLQFSAASDGESSGMSCSNKWSSRSSVSLSETDNSDILVNKYLSEDEYEDESDDDDEIKALKNEIRTEKERNLMLTQLKDSLTKKQVKVNAEVSTAEQRKECVMQEMAGYSTRLGALYKDTASAYQRLVQQSQQIAETLGSRDCLEKKFLYQVMGETLEENFKKFMKNIEIFVEKHKLEVVVPISEGERFLLDSVPSEVATSNCEELRVSILTQELWSYVPRIANLRERQLAAECATFALSAAERLLRDIQTGKHRVTLEQLESKTEELRMSVAQLEAEVEELSRSATLDLLQQARADVVHILLDSARELADILSVKQQAQEKFVQCLETYLCALMLVRSMLAYQLDSICHTTSFVHETHDYITHKHSQVQARVDLMRSLQEKHRDGQARALSDNVLLRTFQKLLLGEDDMHNVSVESVFDLMSASLSQLKAQNNRAWETHYNSFINENMALILANKKQVEALSEYLLPRENDSGFSLYYRNFNDKFEMAKTAVENFIKKKEQFKSHFEVEKGKINQNSHLRKQLLEWVTFMTHSHV